MRSAPIFVFACAAIAADNTALLRDEVVARYQKLDIPTYWCGINATLAPAFDPAGKVTAVGISYPRDFVRQQLSYAAMYGVQ